MIAKSVLITGSNRGIGLELIKQLIAMPSPPDSIFAACRNPESEKAVELKELAAAHSNVYVLRIDMTDEETMRAAYEFIESKTGDKGLNLLINNAGVLTRELTLDEVTMNTMMDTFKINVVGPTLLVKHVLPLLKRAAFSESEEALGSKKAAIINISSLVGSIADNIGGRFYSYRISKCGLNMLTKNLSNEFKKDRILVISLHPGHVLTDIGGLNAKITAEDSAINMLKVISEFSEENDGQFCNYNGVPLPW